MELIFYKSKQHKDYYFIYKAGDGVDPYDMLGKITHTGEHVNSGYTHDEIEMGFVLKTEAKGDFIDYLIEHVATNHIDNSEYDNPTFRSWYEFKDISNTEQWLNDYYAYDNRRRDEFLKANNIGVQTSLF